MVEAEPQDALDELRELPVGAPKIRTHPNAADPRCPCGAAGAAENDSALSAFAEFQIERTA